MVDILKCCKPKPAVVAKRALDQVAVPHEDGAEEGAKEEDGHSAKKVKVDEDAEEKDAAAVKDEEDDKMGVKLDLEKDEAFGEAKEEDVKPVKEEYAVDAEATDVKEDSKDGLKVEE